MERISEREIEFENETEYINFLKRLTNRALYHHVTVMKNGDATNPIPKTIMYKFYDNKVLILEEEV